MCITKLFARGVCVFITEVPITKLFARGGGGSGGHVLRETMCVGVYYCSTYYRAVRELCVCVCLLLQDLVQNSVCVCVYITAVPCVCLLLQDLLL